MVKKSPFFMFSYNLQVRLKKHFLTFRNVIVIFFAFFGNLLDEDIFWRKNSFQGWKEDKKDLKEIKEFLILWLDLGVI